MPGGAPLPKKQRRSSSGLVLGSAEWHRPGDHNTVHANQMDSASGARSKDNAVGDADARHIDTARQAALAGNRQREGHHKHQATEVGGAGVPAAEEGSASTLPARTLAGAGSTRTLAAEVGSARTEAGSARKPAAGVEGARAPEAGKSSARTLAAEVGSARTLAVATIGEVQGSARTGSDRTQAIGVAQASARTLAVAAGGAQGSTRAERGSTRTPAVEVAQSGARTLAAEVGSARILAAAAIREAQGSARTLAAAVVAPAERGTLRTLAVEVAQSRARTLTAEVDSARTRAGAGGVRAKDNAIGDAEARRTATARQAALARASRTEGQPKQQARAKRERGEQEVIYLVSPPRVRAPEQRRLSYGSAMGPWKISKGGTSPMTPLQPSGHGRSLNTDT